MTEMHPYHYDHSDIQEYNPSDLANLVRYCVQELMKRPPYPLPLPGAFPGAGIYALFYRGDFPLYQHLMIRSDDCKQPIYVGRARLTKSSGPRPLFRRLGEHSKSIVAVRESGLKIEDFRCRFLVLQPVWVSTVEDLLIQHYSTLWNDVLEGFGVHDPGKERHTGGIPLWDILHPGRTHLTKMLARGAVGMAENEVRTLVEAYCASHSEPLDEISVDEVQHAAIAAADDEEGDYIDDEDDE